MLVGAEGSGPPIIWNGAQTPFEGPSGKDSPFMQTLFSYPAADAATALSLNVGGGIGSIINGNWGGIAGSAAYPLVTNTFAAFHDLNAEGTAITPQSFAAKMLDYLLTDQTLLKGGGTATDFSNVQMLPGGPTSGGIPDPSILFDQQNNGIFQH